MNYVIETDRLRMREFAQDDAAFMFMLNSDPEVLKYTGDKAFESIDSAKTFLANYHYSDDGLGRWAIELKSNSAFIGWCGLKSNEEQLIDIGFRLFKSQWNQGYATEAAKATLHYGFDNLQLSEIVGRSAQENVASIAVLKKLNLKFWKESECHGIPNAAYYRINRDDFNLNRNRLD